MRLQQETHPGHRRVAGAAGAGHRGRDLPSQRRPRRFRRSRTGPLLHGGQRRRLRRGSHGDPSRATSSPPTPPVEAGFDRFPAGLVEEYLGDYVQELGISMERLLALGADRRRGETFNMAFLAIRVQRGRQRRQPPARRGEPAPVPAALPALAAGRGPRGPRDQRRARPLLGLARSPTLSGPSSAARTAGWAIQAASASLIRAAGDDELWAFRDSARRNLITMARDHVRRQGPIAGSLEALGSDTGCLCDPDVFTIGFARRFATYKRAGPPAPRPRPPGAHPVRPRQPRPAHPRRQGPSRPTAPARP